MTEAPRFMLASGNAHKLLEFRTILAPAEVLAMPAGVELPPEGVDSFAANARAKARALAAALAGRPAGSPDLAVDDPSGPGPGLTEAGLWSLADDSGLEVEALDWAPGVVSSRYAGREGDDAANVARLLRELAGRAGPAARRARFVCELVALAPDGSEHTATGHWWGAIAEAPRGGGGFGYDPVFVPDGSALTVAEWPQRLKDQASHRALAGAALLGLLRQEGLVAGA